MAASLLLRMRGGCSWGLSTGLIAALWLFFFVAHLRASLDAGRPVGLGLMALELVCATLFILRRQPIVVSRSPVAWIAATVGTFGMLTARPTHEAVGGLHELYFVLQTVGAACVVTSLLTLGRSFGIVAANRGIKTKGPYRIVRHPAYASWFVLASGYLLENPSLRNAPIVAAVPTCQLIRMVREQTCLAADPAYVEYRRRVRYRLLPYVY